jgi:hypothetical protein
MEPLADGAGVMTPAVRKRLAAAGVCLVAAIAISVWLFSGESHVPSSGTVGSYLADGLVVVLIVVSVSLTRRAIRAARGSAPRARSA